MNLFNWLMLAHLIGDFLIQTDKMAKYKVQDWSWMLRHIVVYMSLMVFAITIYALRHPLPLWLIVTTLIFIAATHTILDRRKFTNGWMRLTGMSPDHPWLPIVVDQIFHLITLALVAQILAVVKG